MYLSLIHLIYIIPQREKNRDEVCLRKESIAIFWNAEDSAEINDLTSYVSATLKRGSFIFYKQEQGILQIIKAKTPRMLI